MRDRAPKLSDGWPLAWPETQDQWLPTHETPAGQRPFVTCCTSSLWLELHTSFDPNHRPTSSWICSAPPCGRVPVLGPLPPDPRLLPDLSDCPPHLQIGPARMINTNPDLAHVGGVGKVEPQVDPSVSLGASGLSPTPTPSLPTPPHKSQPWVGICSSVGARGW